MVTLANGIKFLKSTIDFIYENMVVTGGRRGLGFDDLKKITTDFR